MRIIEKYYSWFLPSVFQSLIGKTCCAKMKMPQTCHPTYTTWKETSMANSMTNSQNSSLLTYQWHLTELITPSLKNNLHWLPEHHTLLVFFLPQEWQFLNIFCWCLLISPASKYCNIPWPHLFSKPTLLMISLCYLYVNEFQIWSTSQTSSELQTSMFNC